MGQISCGACDSSLGDLKTEMDLKGSIIKSFHQHQDSTSPSTQTSNSIAISADVFGRIEEIIKIQAAWRGHQDRKAISHLLKSHVPPFSYFPKALMQETLRTGRPLPCVVERRPAYRYCSGAQYDGHWLGGFRQGYGVMVWPDSATYDGMWSYGYPAGPGKFVLPAGESFVGKWKYCKAYLRMSLMLEEEGFEDGYVWLAKKELERELKRAEEPKRTWQSDKKVALEEAIQSFKSQLCSHSKFPRYKSSGRTRVTDFSSRDNLYTGEMRNGQKDGWGRSVWPNGDLYEGEWENNNHCGFGISSWADGSRHVGFYRENKKEGVGEYLWEDGSQYLGEWRDNQMHGKGRYMWTDGRCYLGEWVNGQMHGFGVFTWKDGRRYEGGWFQGKKHGEGVTYSPSGRYSRDIWKHGKMIKPDV